MANLSEFYVGEGEVDKARPLLLRSMEINEKNLGRIHPHVAANINNLASLYERTPDGWEGSPVCSRLRGFVR